ncbi:MAG: ABC transporter substrate binding protein [Microvirga sp.]
MGTGLVASLSRPGGNITGVSLFIDALGPKRLEFLRELVPKARSIAMVRPSIQPSSRSRCTKAAVRWVWPEGVLAPRNPMVGAVPVCCAPAPRGQAAAAPRKAARTSRRLIRSPRRRARGEKLESRRRGHARSLD